MKDQHSRRNNRKRMAIAGIILGIAVFAFAVAWLADAGESTSRQSTPAEIAAQEEFQEKFVAAQKEFEQKLAVAAKEAEQKSGSEVKPAPKY